MGQGAAGCEGADLRSGSVLGRVQFEPFCLARGSQSLSHNPRQTCTGHPGTSAGLEGSHR